MAKRPEDFITSYAAALTNQDWKYVEPLIHPNACVTFSNGAVHKGIGAIEEAYSYNFSIIKEERFVISDVHWVLKGENLAIYLFSFHWSGLIDGKEASGTGRGTTTLVFEKEKWQLIAEHLGPF